MIGALNLTRPSNAELLRGLAGPVLIVMLLAMMVLPLPPFMLDMFFTFNIAFSIMVLLVGISTVKPLDFAVFPTVLLVTTLLRLSLNIASTRVVLLEGHTGPAAAGTVIESFGHFLVGDNYAVGLVVFARAVRGEDPEAVFADTRQFSDLGRAEVRRRAALVALELLRP